MPRTSVKLKQARCDEIVNACEKLYQTMGFREVTIKGLSEETSFSRPSIYNYFETKEEVFLALLQREYNTWAGELELIASGHDEMSADELASALAHSLEPRTLMLKIQSMNLYEIEDNSRLECLEDFKRVFRRALNATDSCLKKFRPDMTEQERRDFLYSFFPFINSIYPYVSPTPKQCKAMDNVGVPHPKLTVYAITCSFLKKMLHTDNNE